MDLNVKTSWESIIKAIRYLYSKENTQDIINEGDLTIYSLYHDQFSKLFDKTDLLNSLELDFETPQLYNMGRGILSEFAFTQNQKYIIKIITSSHFKYFLNVLHKDYFDIVQKQDCLLAKTYGICKLNQRDHITHFAIMENLFYEYKQQNSQVITIYDLKGATSARNQKNFDEIYKLQQIHVASNNFNIPLLKGKDEDFKKIDFFNNFPTNIKQNLFEKIIEESNHLANAHAMDYSLMIIVGHNEQIKQSEKMIQINNFGITIGIIDYYQEYNHTKKFENKFKTWIGMNKQGQEISCVDSDTYRKRFQQYFQQFLI